MGIPSNWTQDSSDALSYVMVQAFEEARANPGDWVEPTPADLKIRYLPDMVFPPTGRRGCWHIRISYYGRPPTDLYRQDLLEAAQNFKDRVIQQLSAGDERKFQNYTRGLNQMAAEGLKRRL